MSYNPEKPFECEWTPVTKQESHGGSVEGDCPNKVAWMVERGKRNYHICASCINLPEFSKWRRTLLLK